jgi:hypothetical protein
MREEQFDDEVRRTIDLLDNGFNGATTGFTAAVLDGIAAEKNRSARQRKRNATFTAALVALLILNIFSVQFLVKRSAALSVSQTPTKSLTLTGYEEQDVTIQINKKMTGLSYEK